MVANKRGPVGKPKSWEKAVMAAYMMALGHTMEEAATHAGCSMSSLSNWKVSDWWQDAKAEGIERWQSEIVAKARANITQALEDPDEYAATTRYVADRMIPELAPPKNRMEHSLSHERWLAEMDAEPSGDGEA